MSSDVYLGDEISSDGSNRQNIQRRVSKGNGKISEIMSMLEKTSVGVHYFKIAMLLRESIFLNSVLTNSEVWYGLTSADIDLLEAVDKDLLRRIYKVPNSTPIAGLYLESGIMRIGTLKARRVNFLHYLLKLDKSDMLSRVFYAQWEHAQKQDWVEQVQKDLRDFGMPRDLETIQAKSEYVFKNLTKKKAKEFELRSLIEMKNTKSKSKMKNLNYPKLEMQTYLEELDANLASSVVKFRLRMAHFDENYPDQGPPKPCPLCGNHMDTQSMSFQCAKIREKIPDIGIYEDLFKSDVSKDLAKATKYILEIRNNEE